MQRWLFFSVLFCFYVKTEDEKINRDLFLDQLEKVHKPVTQERHLVFHRHNSTNGIAQILFSDLFYIPCQ